MAKTPAFVNALTAHEKATLLKDEYLFLQEAYEDFDRRALQIKSWSITIYAASIGFALERGLPEMWVLLLISSSLFWYIEATWKSFQYAHQKRMYVIEDYFSGEREESTIELLAITSSWMKRYAQNKRIIPRGSFQSFVMFPHVVAVIISTIMLFYVYCPYP